MCVHRCVAYMRGHFCFPHICASVGFERQKEERALESVGVCMCGGVGGKAEDLTFFERQSFIRTHEPRFVVTPPGVTPGGGAAADCIDSSPLHASGCILRRTYAT
jgi:hypothetical protein